MPSFTRGRIPMTVCSRPRIARRDLHPSSPGISRIRRRRCRGSSASPGESEPGPRLDQSALTPVVTLPRTPSRESRLILPRVAETGGADFERRLSIAKGTIPKSVASTHTATRANTQN